MRGKENQRRYYVGGRWYSPESAMLLCRYDGIFERVTLYQTSKGAFFTLRERTVDEMELNGAAVEVLSRAAARTFMDAHPAGINPEAYVKAFGEPKEG